MTTSTESVRRTTKNVSPEMHGRKVAYTNEKTITSANVIKVLNDALPIHMRNRRDEEYLEKYLRGWQPILERVKAVNAEINNKIVVNIANEIVTFKASEFAGEPIQYVSRSSKKSVPKKVSDLNSMMLAEGKQTKDLELAYQMFTCGVGYRLIIHDESKSAQLEDYMDEAPFEIHIPDPKNTFVVRLNDVSKRPVMGVTFVYLDDAQSKVQYTVYTPDTTYTIEGGMMKAEKIVSAVRHNFGLISLIEYPCNPIRMGAFEVVLPLLDAINLTQSNRLDGVEQFIQAIMVFEGVDITREQFLELKDLGALKLPPAIDGRSSRVYYLNEELNQSQTQTLVDDLYQAILQIVGMPAQGNANSGDSSNNGAVIMKNGWWHAEARALETQAMWKQAETETLKVVLKICSERNALTGLKLSDLEPKFWRQSYEDLLVKTQSFASLHSAGMPAIQAFTYSHLSKDPESDAQIYDAYQEELALKMDIQAGIEAALTGGGSGGGEVAAFGAAGGGGVQMEGDNGPSRKGVGICPICGRSFKKHTNNQVYDRSECRNKAKHTILETGGDTVK